LLAVQYKIKRVDPDDDVIAEEIALLHALTFANQAPPIKPERGWWWLAYDMREPPPTSIAFAGLTEFDCRPKLGYLKRCGVLPYHQGQGLQRKLIRVRENHARKLGMLHIFTDTTDNPASANNLIEAGYRMWSPENPWGFKETLYWRKKL
jgi:GNAT superfamily N-acetyltransferase